MKLLAVCLNRHDTNMAYFDGNILRYTKLERSRQIKRYPLSNRWEWIYAVKQQWGVDISEIDEIVFDFHSNSYYGRNYLPPGFADIATGKRNYLKLDETNNMLVGFTDHKNMWYISHHWAHSLSCWMLTETRPSLNIVIDGEGDGRTWSVFRDDVLLERGYLDDGSIGGEYMRTAMILGCRSFSANDNSGKMMGLQSYGNIDYGYLDQLRTMGIRDIRKIYSYDFWVNYLQDELIAEHRKLDWARTVHIRVNEVIIELMKKYVKGDEVFTYSGGVAQNVVWNAEIKKHFPNVIIPPHSGDDGSSIGSIEFLRIKNNLPPFKWDKFPYIEDDVAPTTEPSDETIKIAAQMLAEGKVIGWYQGNGETGPRALGNRSILMDPRIKHGKAHINRIKKRENYRPFGASVLIEHVNDYFDMTYVDNYMLYSTNVHDPKQFPAITHVDGTCRIQTVTDNNPAFRKLLEEFHRITGCAVLLNTSLNMAGKPLAAYPGIALELFELTALDGMVIGDKVYDKATWKKGNRGQIGVEGVW